MQKSLLYDDAYDIISSYLKDDEHCAECSAF